MTTVPLPGFLPADGLDEFEKFDGPLIYLAAPLGHQDPSVSPNPPKSRGISSGAWVKDSARWRCGYDADAEAF